MNAATPAQAAYEAYRARIDAGDPWPLGGPGEPEPWEVLGDDVTAWFDDMGQAAVAAQEPKAAPGESSPLGLKHAVTSNRLGHALAALREIAGRTEGSGQGLAIAAHGIARNALDDDAAIRDNVELTREPHPAPGSLPCTVCEETGGPHDVPWPEPQAAPELLNSKQERHPGREVNLITDDEREEPTPELGTAWRLLDEARAERDAARDALTRLADGDTQVLDEGLSGSYYEELHVRTSLARQALGLDVCGCTECQVSLGIEPEDE